MLLPGVREALCSLRHAAIVQAEVCDPALVGSAVPWPNDIDFSLANKVAAGVIVTDSWEAGCCGCVRDCYRDTCWNATANLFCAGDSCRLGGKYSNSIYQTSSAEIYITEYTGLGLRTKSTINAGALIAPYTGLLSDHDYVNDPTQYDYVIQTHTVSKQDKTLYIDAEKHGSFARFINHSCDANCTFVEMRHNRDFQVAVITNRKIGCGEAITVDCGPNLWFVCACKTDNCRAKGIAAVKLCVSERKHKSVALSDEVEI
ncbi:SET domain-containing protein [Phytophthora infestans]|uniref:SET domain-containing protein n=1 Tax=Phytophthora infestans TaxID=4787 RepID=A0A833ST29_PHYIN|nr:SET domain-containing protein [Phytophthora infestans]KAF4144048.1 SET domain-containing protein [Phytophthora infestans]